MKAIRVKFMSPTYRLSRRWIASDSDGNRVVITQGERDAAEATAKDLYGSRIAPCGEDMAAYKLCNKMGWTGRLHGGCISVNEYVYVFENVYPVIVKGK